MSHDSIELETREFSADAPVQRLVVRIGAGSVRLTADDRPGVTGTLSGPRVGEATIEQVGDALHIATPRRVNGEHYLTVAIPTGVSLQLGSGSADVEAEVDLAGAQLRTGSGNVSLRGVDDLDFSSGSGSISAERVAGDFARVNTGSGDIVIGECHASARVRSASGDLEISALSAALNANSASGDVDVDRLSGEASVRTASGNVVIGVSEELPAWLDLSSASGRVRVGLDDDAEPDSGQPFVRIKVSTASGDITVDRAGRP